MRHRKSGVKLNRTSSHRDAMFRNMVTSLFKHERIRTTDAKAKELRRWADHLVTLAKRGDLHARRQAMAIVREKNVVHKLFEEAQDKFGQRKGGYTRIIKLGRRPGDAARLSMIELVLGETATQMKKAASKPKKTEIPTPTPAPAPDVREEEKTAVEGETATEASTEAAGETAQAAPGSEEGPSGDTASDEAGPPQADADKKEE
jgi:large subunit ribosomal protein L17